MIVDIVVCMVRPVYFFYVVYFVSLVDLVCSVYRVCSVDSVILLTASIESVFKALRSDLIIDICEIETDAMGRLLGLLS